MAAHVVSRRPNSRLAASWAISMNIGKYELAVMREEIEVQRAIDFATETKSTTLSGYWEGLAHAREQLRIARIVKSILDAEYS